MSDVNHRLIQEIKAADVLKANLTDIAGDDTDLIRDMIEGETNLLALIAKADLQMIQDAALVEASKQAVETIESRATRISKRIELTRAAVMTAMQISERNTLELATGTLTIKSLPAKAIIVDEAQIPSQFWKSQDPILDKKAILSALKEGQSIEGAQLSNGGETLQIRR